MAKIPPRSSFSLYNSTNYLVRVCYNAALLRASNVQDRVSSIHVPPIFDACAVRVHGALTRDNTVHVLAVLSFPLCTSVALTVVLSMYFVSPAHSEAAAPVQGEDLQVL